MVAISYLLLDSSNSSGKLDLGYFFVKLHSSEFHANSENFVQFHVLLKDLLLL